MLGFVQHDMSKLLSLSGRFCKGSYCDNSDMVKAVSFFLWKWIYLGGPAVPHSCNFGAYSCCKRTFLGAGWFRAWNIRQCWMQELMVKLLEGGCKLHFVCKASFVSLLQTTRFLDYPFIKRNWEWRWFWFCHLSSLLELPQWQCPRPEENLITGSGIVNTLHAWQSQASPDSVFTFQWENLWLFCWGEDSWTCNQSDAAFTDSMVVQEGLQF
jgi:hypothetical protein